VVVSCFMPDHVHLLVQGESEGADLKRFVKLSKQHSAFNFASIHGRQRLWLKYGFVRVLRGDEDTSAVARYIINNPVRAGLVSSPAEYPYWGSSRYSREELLEYIQWAA
jgi:putative transposase